MRSGIGQFFSIIALSLSLTACKIVPGEGGGQANFLPPEANDPALAAGLSRDEVLLARKIYQTKCARCHQFYNPADYEEQEWLSWITKMNKKAKLNSEQDQLLSQYLAAFRNTAAVHQ